MRNDVSTTMRDIEERYQRTSGLPDRCWYSIFYSRIDPAPLLVLGLNPGGSPHERDGVKNASNSFFENFEHEYVDCTYPIQAAMLPFLRYVLRATDEDIRHVPKSNLVFRRSPGEDDFKELHGMTMGQAMKEARPFVSEIMHHVQPRMILLETMRLEAFAKLYGAAGGHRLREPLHTVHRGRPCRILDAWLIHVRALERELPVVALGHPSAFGSKPDWPRAMEITQELCAQFSVAVDS